MFAPIIVFALVSWPCSGQEAQEARKAEAGKVTAHSRGLHGYIGFSASRPPAQSEFSAGMGFYSAVWSLIDQPLADFQIGLAGSWITPDNSDNKDRPLAPEGTLARTWKERGPTWASVFQTVEGGLGYWAGNHFRYGPPKFSLNATPQCNDYKVGSPGWSFFYSNEALPDNRLGIAQLSNRLLIPPDALPFEGNPNGQFLGYTWMALPFTDPTTGDPPTGDQSWDWSEAKKAKLQAFVEKIHAAWPTDRDYMSPPSHGKLATLDPALLVTPPKGLELGYVPIVTRQTAQ